MLLLWILVTGLCLGAGYARFCTESYECYEKCTKMEKYYVNCGGFFFGTCSRYRIVIYNCSSTCYRQMCCPGYTGSNCDRPLSHTMTTAETQQESTSKKQPDYTNSTTSYVNTELKTTVKEYNLTTSYTTKTDYSETSISNIFTKQTTQATITDSVISRKTNKTTLTLYSGFESTTTAQGVKPETNNTTTANSNFTSTVHEFSSDDTAILLIFVVVPSGFVIIVIIICICVAIRRGYLRSTCLSCHKKRSSCPRLSCRCFVRKAPQLSSNDLISKHIISLLEPISSQNVVKCCQDELDSEGKKSEIIKKEATTIKNIPVLSCSYRKVAIPDKEDTAKEVCKERVLPDVDVNMCVVLPLNAVENKEEHRDDFVVPYQNNTLDESDKQMLNWNIIFAYLVKLIPPTEWQLFGIYLLGGDKTKVDYIAANAKSRGDNIETSILTLFNHWHATKGRDVNQKDIEEAMSELQWNRQLEEFRDLMKNPPLIKKPMKYPCTNKPTEEVHSMEYAGRNAFNPFDVCKNRYPGNVTVFAAREFEPHSLEDVHIISENATQNISNHSLYATSTQYSEINEFACTMEIPRLVGNIPASNVNNVRYQTGVKRQLRCENPYHVPKRRKISKIGVIHPKRSEACRRSRINKTRSCSELANWNDISKKFIIDLIKLVLPLENPFLPEKAYNLFLDNTVANIVEQTGKSEHTILSIKTEDYKDTKMLTTKSRENHVIDIDSVSLLLNTEIWQQLQLYASARERVLQRITRETSTKLHSEYLFISYQGQPLLEQVSYNSDHEKKEKAENVDCKEAVFKTTNQTSSRLSMVKEKQTHCKSTTEWAILAEDLDPQKTEKGQTPDSKDSGCQTTEKGQTPDCKDLDRQTTETGQTPDCKDLDRQTTETGQTPDCKDLDRQTTETGQTPDCKDLDRQTTETGQTPDCKDWDRQTTETGQTRDCKDSGRQTTEKGQTPDCKDWDRQTTEKDQTPDCKDLDRQTTETGQTPDCKDLDRQTTEKGQTPDCKDLDPQTTETGQTPDCKDWDRQTTKTGQTPDCKDLDRQTTETGQTPDCKDLGRQTTEKDQTPDCKDLDHQTTEIGQTPDCQKTEKGHTPSSKETYFDESVHTKVEGAATCKSTTGWIVFI